MVWLSGRKEKVLTRQWVQRRARPWGYQGVRVRVRVWWVG